MKVHSYIQRFNLILCFFCTAIFTNTVNACSSFVLKNGKNVIVGKNFDWTFDKGILMKNPRNMQKYAYFTHNGQQASWISKYGSVTFNQNGRNMPYGGMNEKGLVVEMLWLEDSKFNLHDNKDYVNELEWIQFQLDNFQSIEEVIASLTNIKIYPVKGKIHYIIADALGKSIIIEYIAGKAHWFEKDPNTCQMITNKTVNFSEKFKTNAKGLKKSNTSELYRYYQLEKQIAAIKNKEDFTEKMAFKMLKSVTIPKGNFKTVWSIVYNIGTKSISYHTHSNNKVKSIQLPYLDFNEHTTYADLNQDVIVNVADLLKPLTPETNYEYMSASLLHLGFDPNLCQELSIHQLNPNHMTTSEFYKNYFHFNIAIPMEADGQHMLFAVMDNENDFKAKIPLVGGFAMGSTFVGTFNFHIYGVKNGTYAMVALLDLNRNNQLDFDSNGNALERYATFTKVILQSENDITFSNMSKYFDQSNSKIQVNWQ